METTAQKGTQTKLPVLDGIIHIPMNPNFRFVFRALTEKDFEQDEKFDFYHLERDVLIRPQIECFFQADGGCIMINGHRGVGKTSLLHGLFRELRWEGFEIIDIWINVARDVSETQLKHKVVKRLFTCLSGGKKNLREVAELAYLRTFANHIVKTDSHEEAAYTQGGVNFKLNKHIGPSLFYKRKKLSTQEMEVLYADYDDSATEDDIINVISQMGGLYRRKPLLNRVWDRLKDVFRTVIKKIWEFFLGKKSRLKIVFLFDELDKIGSVESERVDRLLSSLKNIITGTDASFIAIGGVSENNWYEQQACCDILTQFSPVFQNKIYCPCIWDDVPALLKKIISLTEETYPTGLQISFQELQDYFYYFSRGNLRNFYRTLQMHWKDSCLEFNLLQQQRVKLYAEIQQHLQGSPFFKRINFCEPQERDQKKLEIYRLVDYILKMEVGSELTVNGRVLVHPKSWFEKNSPTSTVSEQPALWGVDLLEIIKCLEVLGYVECSPDSKQPRYWVTEKAASLRELTRQNRIAVGLIKMPVPTATSTNDTTASRECGYCHDKIEDEDGHYWVCGECKTPHHLECWKLNNGCSLFGCSLGSFQLPPTVTGRAISSLEKQETKKTPETSVSPGTNLTDLWAQLALSANHLGVEGKESSTKLASQAILKPSMRARRRLHLDGKSSNKKVRKFKTSSAKYEVIHEQ